MGTVMASFNVEGFGTAGLVDTHPAAVEERYATLRTFVEIPARI